MSNEDKLLGQVLRGVVELGTVDTTFAKLERLVSLYTCLFEQSFGQVLLVECLRFILDLHYLVLEFLTSSVLHESQN